MINNVGLSRGLNKFYIGDFKDWEEMIDINVKGLFYIICYIVLEMVSWGWGYVVNIGFIVGCGVYFKGNVYCVFKVVVRVIFEGLK